MLDGNNRNIKRSIILANIRYNKYWIDIMNLFILNLNFQILIKI